MDLIHILSAVWTNEAVFSKLSEKREEQDHSCYFRDPGQESNSNPHAICLSSKK